jgi:protoporphyrinogen/coproporphyrinogen III oxidase
VSQVIIVGGGIAGLSAAFELHRRGISFTLFEAGSRAGGVVLSEQIDGFTIDAGPDSLLVQKPEGIRLCEELGLKDRLVATKRPRLAYIQRDGRLHPLPAASVLGIPTKWGPFIRTPLFSWPGKLRMGMELAIVKRAGDDDESIGAFMERRFGIEAKEYLAEPLLAGIHAGDVDRLSLRALFPRFREVERTYGSLLRGFRKEQLRRAGPPDRAEPPDGPNGDDAGGVFRSLTGGLSDLIDALVRALPAESIRLRTPATTVSCTGSGYRVETGAGALSAESVVLASPAFATARIVRSFNPTLAELCDQVPYASTATVALAFPRSAVAHPLNGSGFVVPRVERTGLLAASWLSSKWPGRAPDDRVLVRTFVGGARDPKGFELEDSEMVVLSINALRPLLGISGEPLFSRVYRWERASAQHEVGHIARLARIEEALARHPGLFVTGSGFRGVGIPDCVADGRATAAKVDAWLKRN